MTYDDLNIPELYGNITGKGGKNANITFSQTAADKLNEYLALRDRLYPNAGFKYIFTLYEHSTFSKLTEQKLNIALKDLAKKAGINQNVTSHLFRHSLATHLVAD